jgi:hypothetical protein
MIATHSQLPSRTVVRCGSWASTSYGGARHNPVLAAQLVRLLSSLDTIDATRNSSLVHANVIHHRTRSLQPLRNIRATLLKSP